MPIKINDRFPETINQKIFESNSSFYVKERTMGKVYFIFFFQEFFACINKILILTG